MEGNPAAGTMKNVSRGLAVLTVPFTMSFPKVYLLILVASDIFYAISSHFVSRRQFRSRHIVTFQDVQSNSCFIYVINDRQLNKGLVYVSCLLVD